MLLIGLAVALARLAVIVAGLALVVVIAVVLGLLVRLLGHALAEGVGLVVIGAVLVLEGLRVGLALGAALLRRALVLSLGPAVGRSRGRERQGGGGHEYRDDSLGHRVLQCSSHFPHWNTTPQQRRGWSRA